MLFPVHFQYSKGKRREKWIFAQPDFWTTATAAIMATTAVDEDDHDDDDHDGDHDDEDDERDHDDDNYIYAPCSFVHGL